MALIEVIWRKQQLFLKLEKMRITKKMIQFYQQNKTKQKTENSKHEKSDEQLTEISKNDKLSPNKSAQISIRKEEDEEEKKMTENFEPIPHSKKKKEPEPQQDHIEEEKIVENQEMMIYEWWKGIKKGFVLDNILSVVKYLNIKLEGVNERNLETKVGLLIK